jgi:ArsR family transcriptional regulator
MRILTKKSELLKTIAHPMRLCILNCLMSNESCNVTTLTKKMDKPQSTISQHLSKLKSGGIIEGQRNGVEIQYRLVSEEVKLLIHLLLDELEEKKSRDESSMC